METNIPQPEMAMMTQPQVEHRWLQKLVGEWTYETEVTIGPDHSPERATGTERVRSLGELWIQCEGQGEMPGLRSAKAMLCRDLGWVNDDLSLAVRR